MYTPTPQDLSTIETLCPTHVYQAGETVFEIGQSGEEMYVVLSGNVELLFEAGKSTKNLGKGEFFGELAFIGGGHKRTATVKATEESMLGIIDQDAVSLLLVKRPRLVHTIARRTCSYLLQSEQALIDKLKQRNQELQQSIDYLRITREELDSQELLSRTDELTGLYNRRCMDEQLTKFVDRSTTSDEKVALLLLDIDKFKLVNDTYGHQKGDAILANVSQVLKESCRTSDLPCRLGGDEFAIIMPGISVVRVKKLAERIRARIEQLPTIETWCELKIGGSLGGTFHVPGESPEAWFSRADDYLYQAKRSGRNQVVWKESTPAR